MPKKVNKYCPKCNKVTPHKVIQVKSTKKRGTLTLGQRRFKEKIKGYGGFPRPKPENSQKWGVKQTKKLDLRFECEVCGYKVPIKEGFRARKIEWVRA